MEAQEIDKKHKAKAEDSYKTRRNLFLFDRIIHHQDIDNIDKSDFARFEIDDKLINIYATQYYQQSRKDLLKYFDLTPDQIYDRLTGWIKEKQQNETLRLYYINELFRKSIFPREQFGELFDKNFTKQECFYCGITEERVKSLMSCNAIFTKRERGYKLEIDRREANKEYTKKNSVLCCYWCNNAKTDEFSDVEFLQIGKGFRLQWNERLKNHKLEPIPEIIH